MRQRLHLLLGLAAVSCSMLGSGSKQNQHKWSRAQVSAQSFGALESRAVHQAAMIYPDRTAEQPTELPMSLTASDGSGLILRRLEARVVIDGPIAFTELHLRFENPEDRVIEGRFAITLPTGAAVSRLAMAIDGRYMEAEVVELQHARRAYEDALHRGKDPALLEKGAGNDFQARIFPIPARGTKDLILSYSQELPAAATPYRLPLRGLPAIDEVQINAYVGGKEVTLSKKAWAPDRDFEAAADLKGAAGVRSGNVVVARVRPAVDAGADEMKGGVLILFDTSASRGSQFAGQVERLEALVAGLRAAEGDDLTIEVACYDQAVESIYRGRASGFGAKQADLVLARRPLGASDLSAALDWAATSAKAHKRVLLVTDGVVTAGVTDAEALRKTVSAWRGVERLDVVLVGGITDAGLMTRLARGTLSRDGVVVDGALASNEVVARLRAATRSDIAVSVDGAAWVWPARLDGVQPGDEILVYADVPTTKVAEGKAITIRLDGVAQQLTPARVERPLVERAWVKARIDLLSQREGTKDEIIALSTKYRVMSQHTALLVLETEEDYVRFGIDRTALADIMTVGDGKIAVVQRKEIVVNPTPAGGEDEDGDESSKGGKDDKKEKGKEAEAKATGEEDSVTNDISPADDKPATKPEPEPARDPEPTSPAPAVEREDDSEDSDGSGGDSAGSDMQESPRISRRGYTSDEPVETEEDPMEKGEPAYTGRMADVMAQLAAGRTEDALVAAVRWRAEQPGDVMALIALGETLEARGHLTLAARAYGSIIDLFPSRADLRRFAGARLDRLAGWKDGGGAASLASDTYAKAVAQRPDHATGHRQLAYALVREGRLADAFAALEAGLSIEFPDGRFAGATRIMREDLGIVGAAWLAADPSQKAAIEARLTAKDATLATEASLRFVLTWETDANDVDFHIRDAQKGHASFRNKMLRSGGELYEDVTTGYGPECFTINGPPKAAPYRMQIHYYSRGPMGYGMGKVEILRHDGKGGLTFEQRPFVVMNDSAYVDLGTVLTF